MMPVKLDTSGLDRFRKNLKKYRVNILFQRPIYSQIVSLPRTQSSQHLPQCVRLRELTAARRSIVIISHSLSRVTVASRVGGKC